MIEQVLAHRAAKPLVDRQAKPDFGSRQYPPREPVLRGLAQDPFAGEPSDAIPIRQRRHIRGELVIEERHTRLDRRGHRHAIGALEQVVRQPARLIEVQDPSQRACARIGVVRRAVEPRTAGTAQRRQPLTLSVAHGTEPPRVALARIGQIQTRHRGFDAAEAVGQGVNQRLDQAIAKPARQPLKARGDPFGSMLRVTAENFVAAFATQHRLHAARRLTSQ